MIQNGIKTRVVGVDISLERTSIGIVDIRGEIIATCYFTTANHPVIGDYLAVLCEHIQQLVEQNGGFESVRSVGICVPSGNFRTSSIENPPNLPWKGVIPLAAMLRDRLGLAVALANDAHAKALGEQTFGAAHGMRDFAIVSIGHGLGSCFFSNGVPHLGYDGFAGEVGHTCFVPNGRQCGCGKKGCLEAYVAANGIIQNAKDIMAERSEPSKMREVEVLTPHIIHEFCEMGDELAIETYRRTGYYLGLGLAGYASILNPEAIVFTGGIAQAGKWLLEPANQTFEEHIFHNIQGRVKFVVSNLENRTRNMLGASVLAWDVKEYSLFK
ncbi:glucokinase [Prevotellaceae bacterium MN60]|jgi:glucokinase|nr:glucokinase [Prevotellaceae bacterium HUN156]SNU04385.1 glucokinase [Prevotellaceae bacterium MN60]